MCVINNKKYFFLLFILVSVFPPINSYASSLPNLPLRNTFLYEIAEKARSVGLSQDILLSIRPLSKSNFVNLMLDVSKNRDIDSSFSKQIYFDILSALGEQELSDEGLGSYKKSQIYFKPVESLRTDLFYFGADKSERMNIDNGEGEYLYKGFNQTIDLDGMGKIFERFSFYYSVQISSNKEDESAYVKKLYLKYKIGSLAIQAGRDSLWLGPGTHGSLLLSNNAFPLDMVRLGNEEPWNFFGLWKFTIFNAWLSDNAREIKNPELAGMHVVYQPHPIIEIGIDRTALYQGDGKKKSTFSDYWDLFRGKGEHDLKDAGSDQYMGYYFNLYLPFLNKISPLKGGRIYWGKWATDVGTSYSGITSDNLLGVEFNDHAILKGIFLTTGNIDLRFEHSTVLKSFYTHSTYNSGYQYKDQFLGHHMGRLASDAFLKISWRINEANQVDISHDLEKHWQGEQNGPETRREFAFSHRYAGSNWSARTSVSRISIDNIDKNSSIMEHDISNESVSDYLIHLILDYSFF